METLSWSRVEPRLRTGTPWVLSMGGSRGVRIGFEPLRSRLYLRIPAEGDLATPTGAYAELAFELRLDETQYVLEVSTSSSRHFREFHRFASLLAEEYEQADQTATGAFQAAIQGWQELVSPKRILTPEQQTGLMGELLLLEGLLRNRGAQAVDAWIGREVGSPVRHDFRIGRGDFEVKTTRSLARRHFIHGTQQLVPALGHDLFLLSLRLEAAGIDSGRSLPEQVHRVRVLTGTHGTHRESLERKIAAALFNDDDAVFYGERVTMADSPRLVPVNENCPRITPTLLQKNMSPEVVGRIEQVSYQINVEGLGMVAGSVGYNAVLGDIVLEIE